MTQPTVTQAERDYVAGIEQGFSPQSALAQDILAGEFDHAVRAIIDYIRNNPLPEQGLTVEIVPTTVNAFGRGHPND